MTVADNDRLELLSVESHQAITLLLVFLLLRFEIS